MILRLLEATAMDKSSYRCLQLSFSQCLLSANTWKIYKVILDDD
jgi:hypothetical protein